MTFVQLDDKITEHPAMVGLSPFAWTLWIHGLTYCARNLTDGLIPHAVVPRLTSLVDVNKAAAELVDAGRWTHHEDGSYEIVNYLEWNKSKAQIEQEREANRRRVARHRSKTAPP